jgi:hypothetical protein
VIDTVSQNQGDRIARGHAIAEAFVWSRIGDRILEVFQRAAGRPAQLPDWRAEAAE